MDWVNSPATTLKANSPALIPKTEISSKLGGVGKMCSFGEGISMTPLQLGALVSAIANGGTLYYLQHPTTPDEVADFQPRVKRHLDIAPLIPEISDGMAGAVNYGTARSLRVNFSEEEDPWQDRNLFARRNPLRMVCLLRQYRSGPHRGRCLPARRTPDLRSQGRRNFRTHLPQSLRTQFLRRTPCGSRACRHGYRR